ncbi:uncharacterized protein PAC_19940 [Phialocephala subalpina]|uniref:Uncharacterized protein n=1 Tax=Phialocephala subalpina TaxID=576137 RepID=A0A1L7XYF5_9HELO|nr:uncharacterized protein PAC_19940 [Phialocephala subalpina]
MTPVSHAVPPRLNIEASNPALQDSWYMNRHVEGFLQSYGFDSLYIDSIQFAYVVDKDFSLAQPTALQPCAAIRTYSSRYIPPSVQNGTNINQNATRSSQPNSESEFDMGRINCWRVMPALPHLQFLMEGEEPRLTRASGRFGPAEIPMRIDPERPTGANPRDIWHPTTLESENLSRQQLSPLSVVNNGETKCKNKTPLLLALSHFPVSPTIVDPAACLSTVSGPVEESSPSNTITQS